MKIRILPTVIFFIAILAGQNKLQAQYPGVEITGTVIENQSQQPIEFATVLLKDADTQEQITGTTTNPDGTFELQSDRENFFIEVSFLGFVTKTESEISPKDGKVNLGVITLYEDSETLGEVIVRAEKSQTEFKLDKRVFNVGKDLSSSGASVLEVLNNVPSVNVDIEGQISLRGSNGVQILINGKPSVLASEGGNALGTITAEMIEKIEVITNPSAKYDAEGTSGIINIVIKKEERKGVNGSATINVGAPHNHSFGLSLNRRTEKFNLFSQFGGGYREMPNKSENINRDLIANTELLSNGTEYRNEQFYNVILGTDYHINKLNVLTLSGFFAYEIEDQPSSTNFSFYDGSGTLASEWKRTETTQAINPKYKYELQYKKDFEDSKDHTLLFSALGNFFGKDQSSDFVNTYESGAISEENQQTRTNFKEAVYTFKGDYTKPFSDKLTLETGAQYVINDVSNDYAVSDLIGSEWVNDPNLTNLFQFDQKVLGVYGTGAYEGDKWGVKLGLRAENTDLNTLLATTGEENKQNYTNFFPTVHTSYKLNESLSLQAGYSRRVYRPRLWDLNPFFNIRNNFSIRTGNPNLMPEFTDSYELTSIYIIGQTSINFGVYHRYTTDVIERVSTFEDNVNTTKPVNVGSNRTTGVELNTKYNPTKWLSFMVDMNYNYLNRQGSLEGTTFDFDADQWSGKMTAKFKLPKDFDIEFTGQHRSRYQGVQSIRSGNTWGDIGLRKKIMKGKGVISLNVRDIFASRVWETETVQPEFYLYSWRQRGRFITAGFSYGFGKGEAMEFRGRRH